MKRRLLRNWLSLPIVPIPPGMRPSGPSDFSLQALTQNTNVYAEAATTLATSGTNVALTVAQVLAKNIVLTAGASGAFTITLPSTTSILDALGPTMPLDGSFFFELSVWNNATGQAGTLTPGDASTTISLSDNSLPTDTTCKWMVRVNPIVSSALGRPTTLTITKTSTAVAVGSAGSGTVVSVAQTVPPELTISGSPVTTTGTLAIGKATEPANTVWAGPTTGADAQPTFRALVAADIPGGVGGSVSSVAQAVPPEFTISGSPITTSGTLVIGKANESANTVWAGPTTGSPAQPTFRALVAADVAGLTGGFLKSVRLTGSGNWSVPASVSGVWVTMIGAGAGGASSSAAAIPGGGGGGGEKISGEAMSVTPSGTVAYVVGAAGASDADGGDSTFGPLTAKGGHKGTGTTGGAGGGVKGGAGGTAASPGLAGNVGTAESNLFFGGSGAGGAGNGTGASGGPGAGAGGTVQGGAGGVAGGGQGGGGGGAATDYGPGGDGGAGGAVGGTATSTNYGSGGGGGGGKAGGAAGGPGANGDILIVYVG